MKRLAVAVAMVLGLGIAPVASGVTADSAAVANSAANSVEHDFNNDGFADLAIGDPGEDVGTVLNAGGVNVLYGSAAGLTGSGSQLFTQNTAGVGSRAESGDSFGSVLAAGDFDQDSFADLAVGAPSEDGGIRDIGAVNVLYGTAAGLTGSASQIFTQNTDGVAGTAEFGDAFGAVLTAGDFDNDGFADLAIGVPEESTGSPVHSEAGAVDVLYGSSAGLVGTGSQLLTQDTPGVGSSAETFDGLGSALTAGDFDNDGFADLAIGALGEFVGNIDSAGAVNVLYGTAAGLTGSGSEYVTQNSPGVASSAEAHDFFGTALATGDFDNDRFADLAIGVAGEDVGSIRQAGAVNVLYGTPSGLAGTDSQFFTQNTPGVGDSAEQGDVLGGELATGDFDSDGFADLTISVWFESIGNMTHAGAINVLYGTAAGLTGSGSQFFTQNTPGVGSSAEDGDEFSDALAAGDFDSDGWPDLAIGVAGEDVGSIGQAGAINVLNGTAAGLTGSGSQFFTQDSPGIVGTAEEGDSFGSALATSG